MNSPETANIMAMKRASKNDKAYFERLRESNRKLPQPVPPASLAEMFRSLEIAERQLGPFVVPGCGEPGHGDLKSHLDYLARIRAVDPAKHS
jgi:hypothetical protein